jgi:hypothetical protein
LRAIVIIRLAAGETLKKAAEFSELAGTQLLVWSVSTPQIG